MTTTTNKTTGRPTPFEIEDSIEFGERFDELAGPYDGEAGPCVARGALSVAEDRDISPKGERGGVTIFGTPAPMVYAMKGFAPDEGPQGSKLNFVTRFSRPETQPDGTKRPDSVHLLSFDVTVFAQELMDAVFGRAWKPEDRAIDTVIRKLRLKIDPLGGDGGIKAVRGNGYVFVGFPTVEAPDGGG